MSENTGIEWTSTIGPDGTRHKGSTFNGWSGCDKVTAGCKFCYAESLPPSMRRGAEWGPDEPRVVGSADYWRAPLGWNEKAKKLGVRLKVFAHSTSDVFEARDDLDVHRARLFELIEATPDLDWLLLTKRAEEIMRRVPASWREAFPTNVWQLVTTENQATADVRIPLLLRVPAVVRGLSAEPLVGELRIREEWMESATEDGLQWVIGGGESGRAHHVRPCDPDWARQLREDCEDGAIPFFWKQWGEWAPQSSGNHTAPMYVGGTPMWRVGKRDAGRLLDGRVHDGWPMPRFR